MKIFSGRNSKWQLDKSAEVGNLSVAWNNQQIYDVEVIMHVYLYFTVFNVTMTGASYLWYM